MPYAFFALNTKDGPALNSLIETPDEGPGDNCENGGIKVEVGLDENGNGVLDVEEGRVSDKIYL